MKYSGPWGKTIAAIVVTTALSGASLTTAGTASAFNLEEWVNAIRSTMKEYGSSPAMTEEAVVKARLAVAPATTAARGSEIEWDRIASAACKVHKWTGRAWDVDEFLERNYTPEERGAILQQLDLLDNLDGYYSSDGRSLVDSACGAL